MKNRKLRVIGVAALSIASLVVVSLFVRTEDARSDYEQLLLSALKSIPDTQEPAGKGGEPAEEAGMDSPDMAAFADYIKTMDPKTGMVPQGQIQLALQETRALQSMKSGNSRLTWANRINDLGGRTRVIFNDPNDPEHKKVWAGSVTGGLWYNNDAYANEEWHAVDDFWPGLAVACMASDPNSPATFYVGTGESQTALKIYRESCSRGVGIMRSTDAGQTWALMPSTSDWAFVTDIVVRNENGTSVIYAGVISGLYQGKLHESGPSDGLYRSDNGGQSWTQVLPVITGANRPYAPSDIELSADAARIYVGTTYHGEDRKGAACILYSDNGTSWTIMDDYYDKLIGVDVWARNGIPYSFPGRVMLAAAPSNPDVIYALIAAGFTGANNFVFYTDRYLLKSTDKGVTWSEIQSPQPPDGAYGTLANLAWHAMILAVDPLDSQTLWMGGLDVWRTRNAGNDWQKMSYWSPRTPEQALHFVHADVHALKFRPGSPSELLVGTDGGLFYTGQTAEDVPVFAGRNRSYSTLQYYYGAIHPEAGRVYYLGGLQDNGSVLDAEFDGQAGFGTVSGGDGFFCFIDEDQPHMMISTVYYTWLNLFSIPDIQHFQQVASINYSNGTFCNPMDYDWKYNILYANGCGFAGQDANTLRIVRISEDGMTPIPGTPMLNVPTNSPVPYSAIKWYVNSGEFASTIYIGTESGRVFRLAEAMVVGELTELTTNDLPVGNVSSIDIGQTEDTLLLTYSNYGIPSVFVSTNRGQNWKNVEANLPDMPVRWGIFHPKNAGQVMLATELGTWTTNNIFAQNVVWAPDNQGMANVRVDMVKIRTSDNTVLAATHGRGMFTSIWSPGFISGKEDVVAGSRVIHVYPNPCHGRFEVSFDNTEDSDLTIMDATGRIIINEKIRGQQGSWQKSFDLTRHPTGIYLVKVESKNSKSLKRVVIQ